MDTNNQVFQHLNTIKILNEKKTNRIMVSNLVLVIAYSLGLFAITFITTSLPLMFHMSKNTSKIINLIGVGLLLGTGFIVVVPEAILKGCECKGSSHGESGVHAMEGHLEAKNIGLAIVLGYVAMMVADSFVHGHSDDHHHDDMECHENDTSDNEKEGVVVNMNENFLVKLKSSISGLCLHSLFDGLAIGSSTASSNPEVIQTLFWAILLHKVSSSLGTGIFIKRLYIPFHQCRSWLDQLSSHLCSGSIHCHFRCIDAHRHHCLCSSHYPWIECGSPYLAWVCLCF